MSDDDLQARGHLDNSVVIDPYLKMRAGRYVAGKARDAEDAAQLLAALGLDPLECK